jgi:tetratricopeptide (TPR) repeat protein
LYAAAKRLAQRGKDTRLLGMIEQNHGVLANMRGDFSLATRYYKASLEAFEAARDEEPISWILNNLGMLYTRTRNFTEAKSCLVRAAAIAHRRRDRVVENVVALNLAELFVTMERLDLADDLLSRALAQAGRRGDHLTAAGALKLRAMIERKRGALDKAIATLRIAIYEAQGAEDQLLHAEMLRELGEISRALGNAGAAKSAWREAAESFGVVGAKRDVAEVTSRIAELPA